MEIEPFWACIHTLPLDAAQVENQQTQLHMKEALYSQQLASPKEREDNEYGLGIHPPKGWGLFSLITRCGYLS